MHKMIDFTCSCGAVRKARKTRVERGEITTCAACAVKIAGLKRRIPDEQKRKTDAYHIYKTNAKRKGYAFELDKQQLYKLLDGSCFYCGAEKAFGIDRRKNAEGYTQENSVSCCRQCNYAKRDQSEEEFISWIKRAYMKVST